MESNAFLMMSHALFLHVPIWPIFMLDEFPLYITRKKRDYGYHHMKKMKQQWHIGQFFLFSSVNLTKCDIFLLNLAKI
jgi:hypothetical protein